MPQPMLTRRRLAVGAGGIVLALAASMAADRRLEASIREERRADLTTLNRLRAELDDARKAIHDRTARPYRVRAKIEAAARTIAAFAEARPVHLQGYYIRAWSHFGLEDFPRARDDLLKVVALDPSFGPGWSLLGRVLMEQYRRGFYVESASADLPGLQSPREQAVAAFERVGDAPIARWGLDETREERIGAVLTRALERYAAAGDPTEARALLEAEFARDPTVEYANWIGLLQEKTEDNIAWQDRAIDLAPGAARPLVDRGVALASLDADDRALGDLTRGLELSPRFADGFAARGRLHQKAGAYEKALIDFARAIKYSDPAWLDRANVERRMVEARASIR